MRSTIAFGVPAEAKFSVPGFAFASATTSCSVGGNDNEPTSMKGTLATTMIGVKSFSGSAAGFSCVSFATAMLEVPKNSVCPSAGARATDAAAIMVAAPGRFSTTTGCFHAFDSASARWRATMSVAPPVGKPTTTVTGLLGNASALAHEAPAHINASVAATRLTRDEKQLLTGPSHSCCIPELACRASGFRRPSTAARRD
jgi:hypothetical protein